jgi:hypothetical protein
MLTLQRLYAQYTGPQNFSLAEVNTTLTDCWAMAILVGCNMEVDVGKSCFSVKHLHIAIPEDKDRIGRSCWCGRFLFQSIRVLLPNANRVITVFKKIRCKAPKFDKFSLISCNLF